MNRIRIPVSMAVLLTFTTWIVCTGFQSESDENKAIIARANEEILNKGNLAYVDEVFAGDYSLDGVKRGPEAIREFAAEVRDAFPDLHVTVERIVAEGNRVAWQRTHSGTHKGEYMGFPASGKKVKWRGIIISTIKDGKIVEEWSLSDLQQQLRTKP